MDFAAVLGIVLGSSVFAAIITQGGSIILHKLQRKETVEDANNSIMDKLNEIDSKLSSHIESDQRSWADNARTQILRFGDELRIGQAHSFESYTTILERIDDYERYCDKHEDYQNSKAVSTISLIRFAYQKRIENNDFL